MERSAEIYTVALRAVLAITTTTFISKILENHTYPRHLIYLPKYSFLKTRTIEITLMWLNQTAITTLASAVFLVQCLFGKGTTGSRYRPRALQPPDYDVSFGKSATNWSAIPTAGKQTVWGVSEPMNCSTPSGVPRSAPVNSWQLMVPISALKR
jgi:hypothetical protein